MLKSTGVSLEMIKDKDHFLMFEEGIR